MHFGKKIAFVTGAGSGIGQSIAKILAREGARIVAADINQNAATNTIKNLPDPEKHFPIQVDVSNIESVMNAFESVIKHYSKPPTLLAQAAGITRDNFLHKLDKRQFDEVIDVNLKGTFYIQQQFCNHLHDTDEEREAAIVNISSITAKNGNMGQSNYTASKAAVEAFSKSTAKELGKKGIRVNCIRPGFIETPMSETVPDHLKSMLIMFTPLQRMGSPDEVAEVVSFLLSDKSSFMTGAVLDVNGGLSL